MSHFGTAMAIIALGLGLGSAISNGKQETKIRDMQEQIGQLQNDVGALVYKTSGEK